MAHRQAGTFRCGESAACRGTTVSAPGSALVRFELRVVLMASPCSSGLSGRSSRKAGRPLTTKLRKRRCKSVHKVSKNVTTCSQRPYAFLGLREPKSVVHIAAVMRLSRADGLRSPNRTPLAERAERFVSFDYANINNVMAGVPEGTTSSSWVNRSTQAWLSYRGSRSSDRIASGKA